MILKNIKDLDTIPSIVIVGSGPASLSVAISLEKEGISSLILEAGTFERTEISDSFYEGDVIGDPYFDLTHTRRRKFGGSSSGWGSVMSARKLDNYDFKDWPISKSDLDPFLENAKSFLGVKGNLNDDDKNLSSSFKQVKFEYPDVSNFIRNYKDHIFKSSKIHLVVNSYVIDIQGDNEVKKIIVDNNGKIEIQPKILILGCGGIENSRLLLWSRQKSNNQFLKNLPIGKCWMEHINGIGVAGYFGNKSKLESFINQNKQYEGDLVWFAPSESLIKKLNVYNMTLHFSFVDEIPSVKKIIKKLFNLSPNISFKLFSLIGKNLFGPAQLILNCEQKPILENNIRLSSSKKDKFNIPKVELIWSKQEDIKQNSLKVLHEFQNFLDENQLGKIRIYNYLYKKNVWPNVITGDHHHMGGARMGENSKYAVVDKNLKVFGTSNLYIIGSSVFPTGGYANPTFTIVQLSCRLANHLKSKTT